MPRSGSSSSERSDRAAPVSAKSARHTPAAAATPQGVPALGPSGQNPTGVAGPSCPARATSPQHTSTNCDGRLFATVARDGLSSRESTPVTTPRHRGKNTNQEPNQVPATADWPREHSLMADEAEQILLRLRCMTDNPTWFRNVFGFTESDNYDETQKCLQHIRDPETGKINGVYPGTFHQKPLAQLRHEAATAAAACLQKGSVRTTNVVGEAGAMHRDPSHRGSVFQAASQFNCLEFLNQNTTPEQGITGYIRDRTQGPACAVACPAGTAMRNYLVPWTDWRGKKRTGQTAQNQIDCSDPVQRALINVGRDSKDPQLAPLEKHAPIPESERLWTTKNGYLDSDPIRLRKASALIQAVRVNKQKYSDLLGHLTIGIQENTDVTAFRSNNVVSNVTQVYSSAVAVGYSQCEDAPGWADVAQLFLDATYEATLLQGVIEVANHYAGGGTSDNAPKTLLTKVGGGVFNNNTEWIVNAIKRGVEEASSYGVPVDAPIVHFRNIEAGYEVLDSIVTPSAPSIIGGTAPPQSTADEERLHSIQVRQVQIPPGHLENNQHIRCLHQEHQVLRKIWVSRSPNTTGLSNSVKVDGIGVSTDSNGIPGPSGNSVLQVAGNDKVRSELELQASSNGTLVPLFQTRVVGGHGTGAPAILFVSGPVDPTKIEDLKLTVTNFLKTAEKFGLRSVSFPPISGRHFGRYGIIPILQAIADFLEKNPNSCLQNVVFLPYSTDECREVDNFIETKIFDTSGSRSDEEDRWQRRFGHNF